jgi:hypothetical protein
LYCFEPSDLPQGEDSRMTTVFKAIRRRRFAAALALAVIYALCVLAPHAAVALGANAPCLDDAPIAAHLHAAKATAEPHVHGEMHRHGDGMRRLGAETVHRHSNSRLVDNSVPRQSDNSDKNHETCCGLFCLTAIARDVAMVLPPPPPSVTLAALGRDEAHAGRGPVRINRPPIA